jgi:DNA repair protein RecO (recombination protein O)
LHPLTTHALLLDRVPYGEKDLVCTLLTRDAGVLGAIARSARGSRHRFGASLDLFVVFAATVSPRARGLAAITGAEPVRQFPAILEDLERLRVGAAMTVLARDLLRDAPAGPATFEHVVAGLARLDSSPPSLGASGLLRTTLDLLADLGHPPSAGACPACGAAYADGVAFLMPDGVLACRSCARPGAPAVGGDLLRTCLGMETVAPLDRAEALGLVAALAGAALGRPYRLAVD